jgi:hypothetical protein
MRPNTPHYVVTVKDSITHGRHLYTTSCSQSTAQGIIHTFIMTYAVTNALHDDLFTMLRRMMVMWHAFFVNPSPSPTELGSLHVPDIASFAGLMDLIALGNLVELNPVLDRRAYTRHAMGWSESHEMAVARLKYRQLQVYCMKSFIMRVGGKRISLISIFRRSFVEFAAAVLVYKQNRALTGIPKVPGCSPQVFHDRLYSLFDSNYPELVPVLTQLVAKRVTCLYWTGPNIEITAKVNGLGDEDIQLDFDDLPLYVTPEVAGEDDEMDDDSNVGSNGDGGDSDNDRDDGTVKMDEAGDNGHSIDNVSKEAGDDGNSINHVLKLALHRSQRRKGQCCEFSTIFHSTDPSYQQTGNIDIDCRNPLTHVICPKSSCSLPALCSCVMFVFISDVHFVDYCIFISHVLYLLVITNDLVLETTLMAYVNDDLLQFS